MDDIYDIATDFLSRFTYKPGYKFNLGSLWDIGEGTWMIHMTAIRPDANDPENQTLVALSRSIPWRISKEMFSDWFRHLLHDFERFECDEWARLDGEKIKDPHKVTA